MIKTLFKEIIELSISELNELIFLLEEYYNITSKINLNLSNIIENTEESKIELEKNIVQKENEIYIESILPDKKISVLKVIKNLLNLGLKETKEIIDNLPNKIKVTKSKEEAEDYKKQLELAGAIIKIK